MKRLSIALAETIMARYPDPRSIPYKSWCYVHGYVLAGFEKLFELTADRRFLAYLLKYVDAHVSSDGDVPAFTGESLDDMMAGTAIVAAFQKTGDLRYRAAAEKIRRSFADYPRNSDGSFWHAKNLPHEMWIDGVFMGQMFLARFGSVIGDRGACFEEAVRQISIAADRLAKGSSGLYLHGCDEASTAAWADKDTGLSSDVWSEGLGWYALVMAEVLALMKPGDAGRGTVQSILGRLVEALARVQDPKTGLWYQVVDKGDQDDNWHDTSGSAMFVYAIQQAVELGCVDANLYLSVAQKGYAGVLTKASIGPDGLVDIRDACDGLGVQNGYKNYVRHKKVLNAREAIGSVLWASAIMEKPGRPWAACS